MDGGILGLDGNLKIVMGKDSPQNAKLKRRKMWAKDPYCWICGRVMLNGDRTLDHIIPISKGGGNGPNLKLAHARCNRDRGNADATVIVNWLEIYGQLRYALHVFDCGEKKRFAITKDGQFFTEIIATEDKVKAARDAAIDIVGALNYAND